MKCEICGADLNFTKNLYLTMVGNDSTIQCPACNHIMVVVYNRKKQHWETEKERDERRARWTKLKYKVDPKLTEVSISYSPSWRKKRG